MRKHWFPAYLLCLVFWSCSSIITAQDPIQVVVVTGDRSPDGNGVFTVFTPPVLSDFGKVAFQAEMVATDNGTNDNFVIARGDVSGLSILAREGQTGPGNSGVFADFFLLLVCINNNGETLFQAINAQNVSGFFVASAASNNIQLTRLVQSGDEFQNGNRLGFIFGILPSFNDRGEALIRTSLNDGTAGIFLAARDGLQQVALDGIEVSSGEFLNFRAGAGRPRINSAGHAVFLAEIITETVGDDPVLAILTRRDGAFGQVARTGDITPDGLGTILTPSPEQLEPLIGSDGQVAMLLTVQGLTSLFDALFLGDEQGLTELVREGALIGQNELISFLDPPLDQNNSGQIAFRARLGDSSSNALLIADRQGVRVVARDGDSVPDGAGVLEVDRSPPAGTGAVINDAGEMAFLTTLRQVPGCFNCRALFFHDGTGFFEIIRQNDPFLGSTIDGLAFLGSVDEEFNGFNNQGQIAFLFRLDDDRFGIAIATPPFGEPAEPKPDLIFPQFVDGVAGGSMNTSRVVLRNFGTTEATGEVVFRSSNGQEAEITIGGGTASRFDFSVEAGGVFELQTPGTGSFQSGVIEVIQTSGDRTRFSGTEVFELLGSFVSVESAPARGFQRVFVTQNNQERTGIALYNPDSVQFAQVELDLINTNGTVVLSTNLEIGPRTGFLEEPAFFEASLSQNPDFLGSVTVQVTDGGPPVAVLGLVQRRSNGALIAVSTIQP